MKRSRFQQVVSKADALTSSRIDAYCLSNSVVTEQEQYILHCKSSADDSKVVVSLSDYSIRSYDATNGMSRVMSNIGHADRIRDIVFTPTRPDGSIFYSCGEDKKIFGWDTRVSNGKPTSSYQSNVPWVSMDIGCSGNLIAAGSDAEEESTVYFFDVRSSKVLGTYSESHTDAITQVRFNPLRNTELLTASLDGLICFFNICIQGEDEALQSVMNVEDPVQKIGFFGPSLECLYCLSHSETFSLHHIEESACMATFPLIRDQLREKSESGNIGFNPELLIDCFYIEGSRPHSWNITSTLGSASGASSRATSGKTQSLILVSGDHEGNMHMSDVTLKGVQPICSLSNTYGHKACVRAVTFLQRDPGTGVPARFVSGGEDGLLCDWRHNKLEQQQKRTLVNSTSNDPKNETKTKSSSCGKSKLRRKLKSARPY